MDLSQLPETRPLEISVLDEEAHAQLLHIFEQFIELFFGHHRCVEDPWVVVLESKPPFSLAILDELCVVTFGSNSRIAPTV